MIKWDEALAAGKLISKAGYEAMWSPVKLNSGAAHPYGFGWMLRTVNGRRVIEHGGAWQGFKAHIARYPDNKLTVIVFANLAEANQDRLATVVATIVDPELKPKAITDPDPVFSASVRQLFESVIEDKADMSRFTPELAAAIKQSGQRVSASVKLLGAIQKFELVERSEDASSVRYRYRIAYSSASFFLRVGVDKVGKINGFALRPE